MLWDCDSNGVVITNGSTGPVGYSCLYGSDYESISAEDDNPILPADLSIKDDSGNDLKVTLGVGRWIVKVIVVMKNTDPAAGHSDSMRIYLAGGAFNGSGSDQARAYSWTATDGNTYTIYQVCAVSDEILAGTKDVTVKMQVGEVAGTFIATNRSIIAYKTTSFTYV
jgi:hypothetical protein